MANNEVQIANIALLSLGQEMITALTSNEANAKKINAIFNQVVEELEAHDWFFNRARTSITKDGTNPSFGRFDYRYALPSSCIFIRGVCDQYDDNARYEYVREGQYILCNQTSPIYLLYNEKVVQNDGTPDVSKMPLWFHRLISARIAYIIAPNVTENQRIRSKAEMEHQRAWLSARENNGEDAYVEGEQGDNDWRDGARTYIDTYFEGL
jgi:hypothetical protein